MSMSRENASSVLKALTNAPSYDMFDTFLSLADVAKLSKFLGKDPDTRYSYVQTVYQHHGQVVHVPAGWLHQVENLQDCVKIA